MSDDTDHWEDADQESVYRYEDMTECALCQTMFTPGAGVATDYCCYDCYEEDMWPR